MVNRDDRRERDLTIFAIVIAVIVITAFVTFLIWNTYQPGTTVWGPIEMGPGVPE